MKRSPIKDAALALAVEFISHPTLWGCEIKRVYPGAGMKLAALSTHLKNAMDSVAVGDLVEHKTLGIGLVKWCDGQRLGVASLNEPGIGHLVDARECRRL